MANSEIKYKENVLFGQPFASINLNECIQMQLLKINHEKPNDCNALNLKKYISFPGKIYFYFTFVGYSGGDSWLIVMLANTWIFYVL